MGVYPGGDSHPPEAASRTSSSPVGRSGPPSDDEIDLARLVHLLITGKWWIAGCALIALVGAAIYLFAAQPVYRVEALVQIQPEGSSALQEVLQFNPIGGPTAAQAPAQAEIYIIESHDVLGEVVRKLGLDVHAAPDYFPLIGESIARLGVAGKPAQKPVPPEQGSWWSHYAWQPVGIDVRRFILPPALYDETFTLRALGAGQYLLMDEHGNSVLHGQVGTVASGKSADGGQIRLFVASLDASEPPTDFTLSRSPWLSGVDALKRRLEVGLKGETTGVISISVEGEDAQKITAIVNAVAQAYLRQNVEMHSKQAQQSLAFLKKQLPKLRDELEAAENKLAGYRKKHQAVGLDAEAQALLGQVVNIEKQRGQLELELARLRQLYTSEHPKLQAIHSQLQSLAETRKKLEVQIGKLPASQKSILRLRRNVEVNTQLYTALLNRAQELRVVKAGTVGNARIIDEAYVPGLPVPSRASLVLLAALLLGAGVGFALVSLRAALRHTLEDPKRIENELGLPVYAVVPYSGWLARRSRQADRNAQREAPIPARDHPDEATVEALRSLRTSLFFAQMESGSNALLFTGPSPGVGKSFVSINLAWLLAEAGKRIAVVDADMRRGRLHQFLDNAREPGLSQVLAGQLPVQEALRPLDGTSIQILASGQRPPNPTELLMRDTWPALIEELKRRFDMVLIDAPPVLPVTDAAIAAAALSSVTTFMVVRAGRHPMPELEETALRMERQGRRFAGVIFNGLKPTHGSYAGAYSYYSYEYKSHA